MPPRAPIKGDVSLEPPIDPTAAQRRAEVARDESERRYRHLVEHSLGLICTHDLDGRLLSVNPAAARSLGYDAREGAGRHLRDFLVPSTRHLFDGYLHRIRHQGTASGLMRVVARDGTERVWMYHNIRYQEPGSEPYVLGHALDITDRVRVEQALRESEQALKQAYSELDERVNERTRQLEHANERLRAEMGERVRAEAMRERALVRERNILAFLAAASEQLTRVLDYESALSTLARLPVPLLADWTMIHLLDSDGTVRCLPGRHAEPSRERILRDLAAPRETRLPSSCWIADAAAGERITAVADCAAEAGSFAGDAPDAGALARLGFGSLVMVPLLVDGRKGVLSLAANQPGRFTSSDLAVLEDLGRRFQGVIDRVRLYREAQDANRLKEEFLATLSHELRTPLNAILGWARILSTRSLDDGTLRGLEVIERNARAQTRLIEDMLDVSRIVAGKLMLRLEPIDLAVVIGAALDAVRPAAQAKGVSLAEEIEPARLVVQGDAERLQQAIWNLLSNAIKFTHGGGTVTTAVRRMRNSIEVTVRDTGAGIRGEVLPFVFDRFRQADSSTTRSHGGLGLGLAIVRHVVELHGGTVEAQSAGEGKGATFRIQLPAQTADAVELAPDGGRDLPAVASGPLLEGRRVLVVDDHDDARQLVAAIVESAGAAVTTAGSSKEAFEAVLRSAPDVLIADIGMPEEDGCALVRRIRALEPDRGGSIPAIALTAYARVEDRARALAAGFQRHVTKPVEPQTLISIVADVLAR